MSEVLSQVEIDAIQTRCAAATAGPWKAYIEGRDCESGSDFIMTQGDDIEIIASIRDCDFIADAREDVPRLIAEIVRLKGHTAVGTILLREDVEAIQATCDVADQGPWKWVAGNPDKYSGCDFIQTAKKDIIVSGGTVADHDFITQARMDVPRLVAETLRLKNQIED